MRKIRTVCVYCGSGPGVNPAFVNAAKRLGRLFAEGGVRLVYGGGGLGLMGTIARSVLDHGGEVTGIIPEFLVKRERMLREVTDLVVTSDMHERKRMMFERSDGFVALPGGAGTLEETVEMLTWSQLGQHDKPIVLANVEGFWAPLVHLFDHMKAEEFIRSGLQLRYLVADSVDSILPLMREAPPMPVVESQENGAPSLSNL